MSSQCNHCINKEACAECDKDWKDKFIPSDEVKHYFVKAYCGMRGIDGRVYTWNSTNPSLIPTHYINIHNRPYCPYCGETMYPIQDKESLSVIGYCCICQGARNELEYEKKKKELEAKHQTELYDLKKLYENKLTFCSDKLFEIKQKEAERYFKLFASEHNHFNTEHSI